MKWAKNPVDSEWLWWCKYFAKCNGAGPEIEIFLAESDGYTRFIIK